MNLRRTIQQAYNYVKGVPTLSKSPISFSNPLEHPHSIVAAQRGK